VHRAGLILFLLLWAPPGLARSEAPASPPTPFAEELARNVFATALKFMAPRILGEVPVSQLATWGLGGLAALDPELRAELANGKLNMFAGRHLLLTLPAPEAEDADGWAEAVAAMAAAAEGNSAPLQQAGTRGVIGSFFEALFSHLDPYSRYLPPPEADAERSLRSGEGRVPPPETVFATRQGDMLVLRLTGFTHATTWHLERALKRGLRGPHRPRGIVFDLRGNRGGLLNQAAEVAGTVLGSGLVGTTVGRDPEASHVLEAERSDLSGGLPVVVMVDGMSASAAEIVAAALADDRRAVVVGSSTLGKGLVQTVAPLPDGGELFVSWSRVLAPLGWPIQSLGVMPQVCTSLGEAELQRELDSLRAGEPPMRQAVAESRTSGPDVSMPEIARIRSACPAAEGGEADLAAARFLIENPAAYAAALVPAQLFPSISAAPP